MSGKRLDGPPARLQAANDNVPNRKRTGALTVLCEWAKAIPVTTVELDVLEAFFGDVVARLAANDNEPQE